MDTAREALVRTLAIALEGEGTHAETTNEPPSVDVDAVIAQRFSLVALRAKRQLGLNPEQAQALEMDVAAHLLAASRLITHTASVSAALQSAKLPHLVIKGAALGALQGGVSARGAGDVDLLVSPEQLPEVHTVLGSEGFSLAHQMPRFESRGSWRVITTIDREMTYRGSEVDVDVHWRISPQRHLFPDFPTLLSRSSEVIVGEQPVPTASAGDALAMAAFHAYYDRFAMLRGFVDIHRLLPLAEASGLPPFGRTLGSLLAGVLSLHRQLFPGVDDAAIDRLLTQLPRALPMVQRVWDRFGGERSSLRPERRIGNLWQMFLAEQACDSPLQALPRYVAKRLLYFPPSTQTSQHIALPEALKRQAFRILKGIAD